MAWEAAPSGLPIEGCVVDEMKRVESNNQTATMGSTSMPGDAVCRGFFDHAPDILLTVREDGTIREINLSVVDLLGYSREELIGSSVWRLLHRDDLKRVRRLLAEIFQRETPYSEIECRKIHKNGKPRWMRTRIRYLRSGQGEEPLLNIVSRDFTERRRAESALRDSEVQLRRLLESTGAAIVALDLDGRCTFANPSAADLLGYREPSQMIGSSMNLHLPANGAGSRSGENRGRIYEPLDSGCGVCLDDGRFLRAGGESFPVEYRSYPIFHDEKIIGLSVTFFDITERLSMQQQLVYLAEHDHLTGLPNRTLFLDRLEAGIARARRRESLLALFYIDLDRFKPVNDQYGHHAGDRLLQSVTKRLRLAVREMDTVARIGGDEFAIILEDISEAEDATVVSKKLNDLIAPPFYLESGEKLTIGMSVGYALYPNHSDCESLLRHADSAMYQAKKKKCCESG